MDRKGMGMVSIVVLTIMGLLIVTGVAMPIISMARDSQAASETLTRDDAPNQENVTLAQAAAGLTLVDGSLSIAGLTEGANYTIDYDTGVVGFNATVTTNGTYTGSYSYYTAVYNDSAVERSILGLVTLGLLLGLAYFVLKGFGVI